MESQKKHSVCRRDFIKTSAMAGTVLISGTCPTMDATISHVPRGTFVNSNLPSRSVAMPIFELTTNTLARGIGAPVESSTTCPRRMARGIPWPKSPEGGNASKVTATHRNNRLVCLAINIVFLVLSGLLAGLGQVS